MQSFANLVNFFPPHFFLESSEAPANGHNSFNRSAIDDFFDEQSNDSALTSSQVSVSGSEASASISSQRSGRKTPREPLVCNSPGCGESFATKTLFKKHEKAHLALERINASLPPNTTYDPELERPFVCASPGCEWSYKQLYHLKRHHTNIHNRSAGEDVHYTGPTPPKRSYAQVVSAPAVVEFEEEHDVLIHDADH